MKPTPDWSRHAANLSEHISMDGTGFLHPWRWSTIHATMFVGNGKVVDAEIAEMANAGVALWGTRHSDPEWFDEDLPNLLHQRYHLWRWQRENPSIDLSTFASIVEVGAGYGAMAVVCDRMGFRGEYFIYDLPLFAELQIAHLETRGLNFGVSLGTANVWHMTSNPDLLISCYALDEMEVVMRDFYLGHIAPYHFLLALSNSQEWATSWAIKTGKEFVEQPATKGHYIISHKG